MKSPFHGGLLNGFHYLRVSMAGDERPPRKYVINVSIAIYIVNIGALTSFDEERLSADSFEGTHWRVHATGEQLLGLLEEFD